MAAKKKTSTKRKTTVKTVNKPTSYKEDEMYISITDADAKRKQLLMALKSSLILQEEVEQIQELRVIKKSTLEEIKKMMKDLDSNYQKIKTLLPDVDDVVNHTESELAQLEDDVMSELNSESYKEDVERKLQEISRKATVQEEKEVRPKTPSPVKAPEPKTRLDRIQNNLKVIESRLKSI